ncbi:MAG: CRISPR-associated protein Cas10 [Limnoraphis sp. WC205]|nr:CRISPR-associated protein Cas10 [Limnoraphis sp. WC205]
MNETVYTVITFAPVQGFIEKSRKLRDLYGSSYILSFLSWVICQAAEKQKLEVVSPALPNITQGMPNQIILKGHASPEDLRLIKHRFNQAWRLIAETCQDWIENNIKTWTDSKKETHLWDYSIWKRDWDLWKNHAWEYFEASGKPGESITQVRERINQVKASRDWTGINWQGESSTLSGTDAIAYPDLGRIADPRHYNYPAERTKIQAFYEKLSLVLGESFIDIREQLSIPELIKRLITHEMIANRLKEKLPQLEIEDHSDQITKIAKELNPLSFKDLNRLKDSEDEQKYKTGWFLGDGDGAAKYFKKIGKQGIQAEEQGTLSFSQEMREWGKQLIDLQAEYLDNKGRMVYAGGDDFLGVLYKVEEQISPLECFQWFYQFKSQVWHQTKRKIITASVGFVWAGAQVPQRDILQHCHLAEKSAKSGGRDRIAFRILFNSGNHLEWVCPWWMLDQQDLSEAAKKLSLPNLPQKNLIESYRDRSGGKNWTHFYQDVAILESRHAFRGKKIKDSQGKLTENIENSIALGLIQIYFGSDWEAIVSNPKNWWNFYDGDEIQIFTGILGDPKTVNPDCEYYSCFNQNLEDLSQFPSVKQALNNWVINLAQVGFHLTKENE